MTVSITLKGCARVMSGRTILHPLDLTIERGETMVLLGPSGCGKTSLLRMIAGFDAPSPGGRILFDQRDVTALPIEKRNVGMVFQNYALFPHMNVRQNIEYGLKIRGLTPDRRRVRSAEMLEMLRLSALADRSVQALSGGQRQRVALARALAPNPDILLLDEPLSALDASLKEAVRADIDATLKQFGTTAIYVSHDQQEAMMLADRIAVLKEGRIEQVGTPEQLWLTPGTRFVAEFFGGGTLVPVRHEGHSLLIGRSCIDWPDKSPSPCERLLLLRSDSIVPFETGMQGGIDLVVEATRFLGDRIRLETILAGQSLSFDLPPDREYPTGSCRVALRPERVALVPALSSQDKESPFFS